MNENFIYLNKNKLKINKINLKLHSIITPHKFAPIYDSGCCLGREYEDLKIERLINDAKMLEIYLNKGESEIHWEGLGKKSKHFELLQLLLEKYPNQTKTYINRIKDRFDENKIVEIVRNIDVNLPKELFIPFIHTK